MVRRPVGRRSKRPKKRPSRNSRLIANPHDKAEPEPADDTDGDGVCESDDGCPLDADKTDPGLCGCGVDENDDSDGDGIPDCDDQCPGADDAIFAPDCVDAIPTVSSWGLVILALLLLTGGKLLAVARQQGPPQTSL